MKVDIIKLRHVLDILLTQIEEKNKDALELSVDFYWDISSEEIYDPYKTPRDFSLGQLSDDWHVIAKLHENSSNLVVYDLKRISEILKAISLSCSI